MFWQVQWAQGCGWAQEKYSHCHTAEARGEEAKGRHQWRAQLDCPESSPYSLQEMKDSTDWHEEPKEELQKTKKNDKATKDVESKLVKLKTKRKKWNQHREGKSYSRNKNALPKR